MNNIKQSKEKLMSQEKKANLYMAMGVMLELVTFMWSVKDLIPNIAFIGIAIIGILPAIKMIRTDFVEPDENEQAYWVEATHSTGKLLFIGLICFWVVACVDEVFELPIYVDEKYIVPYMIGIAYWFTGYNFKFNKMLDDEDEEE